MIRIFTTFEYILLPCSSKILCNKISSKGGMIMGVIEEIRRRKFKSTILARNLVFLAIISWMVFWVADVVRYPEEYSEHRRYDLLVEIESGNAKALEYYENFYTSRDVYLFDGPVTLELMAEKYGYTPEWLEYQMTAGGYESAQELFDGYVREDRDV